MKKKAVAIIALLGLAAAGAAYARAREQAIADTPAGEGGGFSWPTFDLSAIDAWTQHNTVEVETNTVTYTPTPSAAAQVRALRETIKQAEGTTQRADPYRVCYGYKHTIQNMADHPAVTGEWLGERLPDTMCKNAGFDPGCVSSAAGAYQIIKPTWQRVAKKIGVRDFSPASQDAVCDELIRERGALAKITAGDLTGAVRLIAAEWASLPGNTAGQGKREPAWLQARFTEAGGVLA